MTSCSEFGMLGLGLISVRSVVQVYPGPFDVRESAYRVTILHTCWTFCQPCTVTSPARPSPSRVPGRPSAPSPRRRSASCDQVTGRQPEHHYPDPSRDVSSPNQVIRVIAPAGIPRRDFMALDVQAPGGAQRRQSRRTIPFNYLDAMRCTAGFDPSGTPSRKVRSPPASGRAIRKSAP